MIQEIAELQEQFYRESVGKISQMDDLYTLDFVEWLIKELPSSQWQKYPENTPPMDGTWFLGKFFNDQITPAIVKYFSSCGGKRWVDIDGNLWGVDALKSFMLIPEEKP